jgi:hypothetical protein
MSEIVDTAPAVESVPVESTESVENPIVEEASSEGGAAVTPPVETAPADKVPVEPTVDYSAKYKQSEDIVVKQQNFLTGIQSLAKQGNMDAVLEALGVPKPASKEPQVDHLGNFAENMGYSPDDTNAFMQAVQQSVAPLLEARDKEIAEYKQSLQYLMQQSGNATIQQLRQKNPGFEKHEAAISDAMRKHNMTAEQAYQFVSASEREATLKQQAIEEYKKSVQAKKGASGVNLPGDISKATSGMPSFKDFGDCFNYTKNLMLN